MHLRRASLTVVVLGLLTLVLGHQLVFFLAHGASAHEVALEPSGHRAYLGLFAVSVALISGGLGITACLQVRRLQRSLASHSHGLIGALGAFPGTVARLWVRILVVAVALFLLQENLEHLAAGMPAPGLGVLWGADYGPAALVLAGVAGLVAMVAGLVRWHHDALARLAAARRRPLRSTHGASPPRALDLALPEGVLSRRKAGRAPPQLLRA